VTDGTSRRSWTGWTPGSFTASVPGGSAQIAVDRKVERDGSGVEDEIAALEKNQVQRMAVDHAEAGMGDKVAGVDRAGPAPPSARCPD